MNDHDAHMDLLARAAGTTTAGQVEEPTRPGRSVPRWAAHLMAAALAVVALAWIASVVAPYVLANLKT